MTKKNKKKKLLLTLFISFGFIASFSLIVGLSSLTRYKAINPIEQVQKEARKITGVTFNPAAFDLLSSYEVIRDKLFEKQDDEYRLKTNNVEKYFNFYQVINQKSELIQSFPKDIKLVFDVIEPLDDTQEFKILFHFQQSINNQIFNSEIKQVNLAVKNQKEFLINSFISEVLKSFTPGEKSDLHDNKPEDIFDINGIRINPVEAKKSPSLTLVDDFNSEIKKIRTVNDFLRILNQYFNLNEVINSLNKPISYKDKEITPFKLEFVKDTENQESFITENPDHKGIYNFYLKISFADSFKEFIANEEDKNFSKTLVLTLSKDVFGTESFFIQPNKLFDFVSMKNIDYKKVPKTDATILSNYDILSFQNFLTSEDNSTSNLSDWTFQQKAYVNNKEKLFSKFLEQKINGFLNSKLELNFANFFDADYKNSFHFELKNNIVAKQDAKGIYLNIPYKIIINSAYRKNEEVETIIAKDYNLELRGFKDGGLLVSLYNKYIQDWNFKLPENDTPILPNLEILNALFSSVNDLNSSNFVVEPSITNKISKEIHPLEPMSGEFLKQLINLNKTDELVKALQDKKYFGLSFSELDYLNNIQSKYNLPSLERIRKSSIKMDLAKSYTSNFDIVGTLDIFKNKAEVGSFFALLLKEKPDIVKEYLEVIFNKFASFLKQNSQNSSESNVKINNFNLTNSTVNDDSFDSNFTIKPITKFSYSKYNQSQLATMFYQYLAKIDTNLKNLSTKNLDNSYFSDLSSSTYSLSNSQIISNGITYRHNNTEAKQVFLKDKINLQEKTYSFNNKLINSLDEFLLSFYFVAGLKQNYKGFDNLAKGWKTQIHFELLPSDLSKFNNSDHLNLAYWYDFYLPISDSDLGTPIFRTPKIGMSLKISNETIVDFKQKIRLNELSSNLPATALRTTLATVYVTYMTPYGFPSTKKADKQLDDNDITQRFGGSDLNSEQTAKAFEELFGHPELVRLQAYLNNAKFIYKANSNFKSRFNPQTRILYFYLISDNNQIESKPFSIVITSIPKPKVSAETTA